MFIPNWFSNSLGVPGQLYAEMGQDKPCIKLEGAIPFALEMDEELGAKL